MFNSVAAITVPSCGCNCRDPSKRSALFCRLRSAWRRLISDENLGEIYYLAQIQYQNYPIVDGSDAFDILPAQAGDCFVRRLNRRGFDRDELAGGVDDQPHVALADFDHDQPRAQVYGNSFESESHPQV